MIKLSCVPSLSSHFRDSRIRHVSYRCADVSSVGGRRSFTSRQYRCVQMFTPRSITADLLSRAQRGCVDCSRFRSTISDTDIHVARSKVECRLLPLLLLLLLLLMLRQDIISSFFHFHLSRYPLLISLFHSRLKTCPHL